jgi:hypothetical protein
VRVAQIFFSHKRLPAPTSPVTMGEEYKRVRIQRFAQLEERETPEGA